MMKTYLRPDKNTWDKLLKRPVFDNSALQEKVKAVLANVKQQGDTAVQQYTTQFDGVNLDSFVVSQAEIEEGSTLVSADLKQAIEQAANNIKAFHSKQLRPIDMLETMPGIQCWRKSVGIEKVGLYIPGGSAPLFSTILMLGIPAQLAGCKEVVLCSPPNKAGKLHPAILFAAQLVGITKIFKIGGVQRLVLWLMVLQLYHKYIKYSVPEISLLPVPNN